MATEIQGSKGEIKVHKALQSLGFEYVSEYVSEIFTYMTSKFQRDATFKGLLGIGGRRLKYDFKVYLNSVDFVIIEFDGRGHEGPVNWGGCSNAKAIEIYDTIHRHDLIKNDYCRWQGINLLRIPRTMYGYINLIVKCFLNKCRRELISDDIANMQDIIDLEIDNMIDDIETFVNVCNAIDDRL